ncbi:MAG: FAD-dependent oxidoreductase [Phycisphaeraceae bacterium]|nr:FAD-dependent oxidoreductase [Phycisphaeraceae bacterium]
MSRLSSHTASIDPTTTIPPNTTETRLLPDAFDFDVLIMGGGVAGLWTACHLADLGFSCVLVERLALGSEQTIASQGIIHGGIKYALTGEASRASRAIARMPEIWRACLAGKTGEAMIDLRAANLLSDHQHLWTTPGLISRIAAVAASKAIRTPVERVERSNLPAFFSGAPRGVDVYRVDEPVLDSRSIVIALADQARWRGVPLLSPATPGSSAPRENPSLRAFVDGAHHGFELSIDNPAGSPGVATLRASTLVLAAGAANQSLARQARLINPDERIMQVRPLHMVMARNLPESCLAYGHCLGPSSTPRLTITSAPLTPNNESGAPSWVWNIGGAIAESGVDKNQPAQIAAARSELRDCLSWLNFDSVQLATARWDRAEGLTLDGSRPDEPVIRPLGPSGRALAAWPTKLAFAPELARLIGDALRDAGATPTPRQDPPIERDIIASAAWRPAHVASPPWLREGVVWN